MKLLKVVACAAFVLGIAAGCPAKKVAPKTGDKKVEAPAKADADAKKAEGDEKAAPATKDK